MNPTDTPPTLQAIVGALVFTAKQPLSLAQMRKVLADVASEYGGAAATLAQTDDAAQTAALQASAATLVSGDLALALKEVAQGYRHENRIECGPWVRQLL
ncbi:MAG: hypothetical protein K9N49_08870, partial [Candidatus Marinimicrobia bacterium]|nr:hypothetical protein [Candidatus Neomarinimicrobiota bacterium]